MRRRTRALAVAAALAAAAARGLAAESGTALAIEVATPLFAGSDLVVEVRQGGALAGRALAVHLAIDGVSVGRFETNGAITELRAPGPASAGSHEILVKSGSHRAAVTIRVWPRWSLPAAGVLCALALATAVWALRRRRARAPRGGTAPA